MNISIRVLLHQTVYGCGQLLGCVCSDTGWSVYFKAS